eukprot:TRINITY_DN17364_c0_g1_i1.p1 TRINITY_DN17364_c0_g1~~TRINITY_DN17364_c0_g1_i1.p1  ORF type:complete len:206 (-),score=28.88 TRINITY_DN17364_c0_g1_i1:52-627(-)
MNVPSVVILCTFACIALFCTVGFTYYNTGKGNSNSVHSPSLKSTKSGEEPVGEMSTGAVGSVGSVGGLMTGVRIAAPKLAYTVTLHNSLPSMKDINAIVEFKCIDGTVVKDVHTLAHGEAYKPEERTLKKDSATFACPVTRVVLESDGQQFEVGEPYQIHSPTSNLHLHVMSSQANGRSLGTWEVEQKVEN